MLVRGTTLRTLMTDGLCKEGSTDCCRTNLVFKLLYFPIPDVRGVEEGEKLFFTC